jgi:hypothetical protein
MPDDVEPLGPEDDKLVTLARATRARTSAAEAAAVRDGTGRTYAAGAVTLPSLTLTALQAAVAVAVASGATSLEAAAVVGDPADGDEASLAAVRDLAGFGILVVLAGVDGTVKGTVRS